MNAVPSTLQNLYRDRGPGKRRVRPTAEKLRELETLLSRTAHHDDDDDEDFQHDEDHSSSGSESAEHDSENEARGERVPGKPCVDRHHDYQGGESTDTTLSLRQRALEVREEPESDLCCICMSAESSEDEILLFCEGKGCTVAVHPDCYGLSEVPTDEWKCDMCLEPSIWPKRCALCPVRYGAMKPLARGDGWAHVLCTTWVRDAHFGDPGALAALHVDQIPPREWGRACAVCGQTAGVTVPCDAGHCRARMHVACCGEYDLIEEVDDPDMASPTFLMCPRHVYPPPDGRIKLNGWARWARARTRRRIAEAALHHDPPAASSKRGAGTAAFANGNGGPRSNVDAAIVDVDAQLELLEARYPHMRPDPNATAAAAKKGQRGASESPPRVGLAELLAHHDEMERARPPPRGATRGGRRARGRKRKVGQSASQRRVKAAGAKNATPDPAPVNAAAHASAPRTPERDAAIALFVADEVLPTPRSPGGAALELRPPSSSSGSGSSGRASEIVVLSSDSDREPDADTTKKRRAATHMPVAFRAPTSETQATPRMRAGASVAKTANIASRRGGSASAINHGSDHDRDQPHRPSRGRGSAARPQLPAASRDAAVVAPSAKRGGGRGSATRRSHRRRKARVILDM